MTKLTAATITNDQLRELFAGHCECRPLDLHRGKDDHAAIHDCDTEILTDIQIALGLALFNDIGRVQAIRAARARCAEVINATDGPITDVQIRDLRKLLLNGPADSRQLHGLVDCHDALGRSHRRSEARARCAELVDALRRGA